MLNQNQIKDLIFADVTAAEAAGRPNEICYVQSMKTLYDYVVAGSGYTVNHTSILSTGNGGDTRWRARAGQYVVDVVDFKGGLKTIDPTDPDGVGDRGYYSDIVAENGIEKIWYHKSGDESTDLDEAVEKMHEHLSPVVIVSQTSQNNVEIIAYT